MHLFPLLQEPFNQKLHGTSILGTCAFLGCSDLFDDSEAFRNCENAVDALSARMKKIQSSGYPQKVAYLVPRPVLLNDSQHLVIATDMRLPWSFGGWQSRDFQEQLGCWVGA